MAYEDENQSQGSSLPGYAGALAGGAGGAAWRYKVSQKNAAQGLNYENAVAGTDLGLIKEHMAAEEKGLHQGKAVTDEWNRVVNSRITEKPVKPSHEWHDTVQFKKANAADFAAESELHKLNNAYHDIKGKVDTHTPGLAKQQLQADLKAAEAELHNVAASRIKVTHELKPLEENVAKEIGEVTKAMPKGSLRSAVIGGAVLAGIGGLAAHTLFGGSKNRPAPSHVDQLQAQRAAAEAAQQQGPAV